MDNEPAAGPREGKRSSLWYALAAIALIFLAGIGAYFIFGRGGEREKLTAEQTRVQNDLSAARSKVEAERGRLSGLEQRYRDAYPLFATAGIEYEKMAAAVRRTDPFFDGAGTENPSINIPTASASAAADINESRLHADNIVAAWGRKLVLSRAREITPAALGELRRDAGTVRAFIEELARIVNALTPANSGLTQFQIDERQSSLAVAGIDMESAVASLGSAIDNAQTAPANPAPAEEEIAYEDITEQEETVAEAETEVADLEEELEEIEEAIENLPDETEDEDDPDEESGEDEDSDEEDDSDESEDSGGSDISEDEEEDEIIVQPGPPELIQGENNY